MPITVFVGMTDPYPDTVRLPIIALLFFFYVILNLLTTEPVLSRAFDAFLPPENNECTCLMILRACPVGTFRILLVEVL